MKAMSVSVLALLLVGCIHQPTAQHTLGAVQAPPPNPALVASCNNTMSWHNAWVLAGTVLGGVGGAGGAVDAVSTDHNVQTGIAIGIAAAGLLGAISTAAAGITANTYSNDNCPAILQQNVNSSAAPQ